MEEKKKRDSSCIVISCVDRREEAIKREWTIVALIIAVHLLLLFAGYALYHE